MLKYTVYSILTLILLFLLHGCSEESVNNTIENNTHGVFVLYEGTGSPGTGDYAFIKMDSGIVTNNLFQNANNGATLGLYPDGIFLYGQDLYVTSQGNYGYPGRMFRINASNNVLKDTLTFGKNPTDFALALGSFFVTNLSGSYVTRVSLDMQIQNADIEVGMNPAEIIFAVSGLYVTKASYTSENSVAVINPQNDHVSKVFLTAPPVSAAYMFNGVYVSSFTNKKLYMIDTVLAPTTVKDSITIPTTLPAIGDVVAGVFPNLYVVAMDIVSYSNVGRLVYQVNLYTKTVSLLINDPSNINIYGIAYDNVKQRIYVADSKNGAANGVVRSYKIDGQNLGTYDIGTKWPKKFAFMN